MRKQADEGAFQSELEGFGEEPATGGLYSGVQIG